MENIFRNFLKLTLAFFFNSFKPLIFALREPILMDQLIRPPVSKMPAVPTSIFAVMSGLANEHNAINLSQGFPDFPISQELIDLVNQYMKDGWNQYSPMPGILPLRERIAEKVQKQYHSSYDPGSEITITSGATQALYTAITAFIHPGDEVIIFEPAYDLYEPVVKLNGGIVKHIRLMPPDYGIEWKKVKDQITDKTRMIITNTPNNPTGKVLSEDDIKQLTQLISDTNIILLSDEVYEHIIFDGLPHLSASKYPALAQRSFIIGSFGKTFHATGWKVGYAMAPQKMMEEFRKVHQFIVFAVNTPIQHALAKFLENENNYMHLHVYYEKKRNSFLSRIKSSRFKIIPTHGTYFQLLDFSNISNEQEFAFARKMTIENKLASVPVSSFYHDGLDRKILRFCFAKKEETLEKAAEILCRI